MQCVCGEGVEVYPGKEGIFVVTTARVKVMGFRRQAYVIPEAATATTARL